MRAGLLSDPRVVALLRELFVPCHVSALNTPQHMADPRDVETLAGFVGDSTDDFDGGEREAFVLPDGRMLDVFLSLHGPDVYNGQVQMTASGRRSEEAVQPFRSHAKKALLAAHGELPDAWDALWSGTHAAVVEVAEAPPRWPEPPAGEQALRVFVRNSYRMYDDLHGCELVPLSGKRAADWLAGLTSPGAEATLPDDLFLALVRAMVPRGQVGTCLAEPSVSGSLTLRVTSVGEGGLVEGIVEGEFAQLPADESEVGLREHAACLFASRGKLVGRFTSAPDGGLRELRFVAEGVDMEWKTPHRRMAGDFAPWHRIAVEWVRGG